MQQLQPSTYATYAVCRTRRCQQKQCHELEHQTLFDCKRYQNSKKSRVLPADKIILFVFYICER